MTEQEGPTSLTRVRRMLPLVLVPVIVVVLIAVVSTGEDQDAPKTSAPARVTPADQEAASKPTAPPAPIATTPARTTSTLQRFPDDWFFKDPQTGRRRPIPATLEGEPLPRLALVDWIGTPVDLDRLEGKIVIIDFWATWCRPCVMAIPKNIKLVKDYEDKDVVFIGVHQTARGFEFAPRVVQQYQVNYPIAKDHQQKSQRAFKVSRWPTYIIADHRGTVRASGLLPNHIGDVVQALYDEREAEEQKAEENREKAEETGE